MLNHYGPRTVIEPLTEIHISLKQTPTNYIVIDTQISVGIIKSIIKRILMNTFQDTPTLSLNRTVFLL